MVVALARNSRRKFPVFYKGMVMEHTWIAIIASLLMGAGAVLIFIFSVEKNYFQDLEDAKYQVFWSDIEDLVDTAKKNDISSTKQKISHQDLSITDERDSNNGNQENCN